MTRRTIGIIGAGQAGAALAQAAVRAGDAVVLANSRGPHTLGDLVRGLGPAARAATAAEAAEAGDLVVLAFPYARHSRLPERELAGKVVIDINNHMPWRDGRFPEVDSGSMTEHELRQQQLPAAMIVKAFTHVQFHARVPMRVPGDAVPAVLRLARPAGAPDRRALIVSSDVPEAARAVARFVDDLGFDPVDSSPLRESWRSAPGTPMWRHAVDGQGRDALLRDLLRAERAVR